MYNQEKIFLKECARDEESYQKLLEFFKKTENGGIAESYQDNTRYRFLAESASDSIITIDQNSTILFANESTEKIFGYSVAELIGNKLTILMPEYMRHLHETGMSRYIQTGQKHNSWKAIELVGLHKNGKEISLEISFGKFIEDGNPLFTGIIRDITERKKMEAELERSRSNALAIIENTPDSIWAVDRNYRIITFNTSFDDSFFKTYGIHLRIGAHASELVPSEVYEFWKTLYDRALNGERFSFDHEYEESGNKHYIEISLNPILSGDEITGVAAFSRDVTERKRNEGHMLNFWH